MSNVLKIVRCDAVGEWRCDVHGYIAVVMDVPSINTLRLLVDKFVNQQIG
jgi:hypothetical protein